MKVSICMITYNHEGYIRQAIESVLNQSANFHFHLVIGEDNSTDNTRMICQEYATDHPEKIQLIVSDNNVGMMANFIRTLSACTGSYVAFLEGDDYWTDTGKLSKQVQFLEQHPEFSACFHNVEVKMDRQGQKKEWMLHQQLEKDIFTTEDILNPWFIPSPSFMCVNYPDLNLPEWFYHCKYGDLPLMLLLSLRGPFKYLPEAMAVYRLHNTGMSIVHKQYDKIILMIYIYESFNIFTQHRFAGKIKDAQIYEIRRHVPPEDVHSPNAIKRPALSFQRRALNKIKKLLHQSS